ncbi:hypothetical protein PCANC_16211 [Puccinia coronata f. sp. avenae]|uniref:Uncharacterized protein n=1 Tax=Puccinia coronata f. sp. avenae TaxID=200324 RepID=A0A2N5TKX6_9BASI|nr:hypothetical protein PCANC_24882 [Puccinia coronata f. sp. avenae]PLW36355.1 hypothetical protein PCANC_16211 [Puccinia coronata f. sp. avenae]
MPGLYLKSATKDDRKLVLEGSHLVEACNSGHPWLYLENVLYRSVQASPHIRLSTIFRCSMIEKPLTACNPQGWRGPNEGRNSPFCLSPSCHTVMALFMLALESLNGSHSVLSPLSLPTIITILDPWAAPV